MGKGAGGCARPALLIDSPDDRRLLSQPSQRDTRAHWHGRLLSGGVDDPEEWLVRHGGSAVDPAGWARILSAYRCPTTGWSLRVPNQIDNRPGARVALGLLSIFCDVLDELDRPIGDVILGVEPDADGALELRIGAADVRRAVNRHGAGEDDARMGRGFMGGALAHIEHAARRRGIGHASLHAVGAGCVAWARLGFGFDVRGSNATDATAARRAAAWDVGMSMTGSLARYVHDGKLPPTVIDTFEMLLDDGPTTPNHLIDWGDRWEIELDGRRLGAGRAAMIDSGNWSGYKTLLPPDRARHLPCPDGR